MLVLSRKEGQRVLIGDNIVITINRVSGNRITLGIEAPKDVRVVRGELEANIPQGLSLVSGNGNVMDGLEIELPAPLAERMRSSRGASTKAR